MRRFIQNFFVDRFSNPILSNLSDGALLKVNGSELVFTTDSYVIKPLFFSGGDIGKLSICGTVNDLSVMGARPLYLSVGFILEEGLDISVLERIVISIAETANEAGVTIVTGDTKVVSRGECDGVFINTAGIGIVNPGEKLSDVPIAAGDVIILSGTIGDHGIAVLGARNELHFQTEIKSDCAALNELISTILRFSSSIKWMRDPTRGGVAAVLSELVESKNFSALVREVDVPVNNDVGMVCELLGFDPLHLANEGKVLMVVEEKKSLEVLETLRLHPLGEKANIIGIITPEKSGQVIIETSVGGKRRLHRPAGELLPRIC